MMFKFNYIYRTGNSCKFHKTDVNLFRLLFRYQHIYVYINCLSIPLNRVKLMFVLKDNVNSNEKKTEREEKISATAGSYSTN